MENWIDLSNIPTKLGQGRHKNNVVYDWANCDNVFANFYYKGIYGRINIIQKYNESNLLIKYNNGTYLMHHQSLLKCRLGRILNQVQNSTKENIKYQKENRLGLTGTNNQGCLMKVIEYNGTKNVIVEFQDNYKFKSKTNWSNFINGTVRNPYYASVFNIGIIGDNQVKINGKHTKEYEAWHDILKRCYSKKLKKERPTYIGVECCKEWLLFDNFCSWLHSQENYQKWLGTERWAVDKDILIKGNKIYSPETCCLVSPEINSLFTKRQNHRGELPIGVVPHFDKYEANYHNGTGKRIHLGYYETPTKAFNAYKSAKKKYIKKVATASYKNHDITKECYEAIMNYKVEMTD